MAEDEEANWAAPIRKRRWLEPLSLDSLGVEELSLYIGALKDEIVRVEGEIQRKQSHRSAADMVFRKPAG